MKKLLCIILVVLEICIPNIQVMAQDINDNGNTGTVHLEVLASDANLGSATGSGDYNIGDEVKLQAQPKDGCSFVEFKDESGASLSAEADYTFVIEKNMTVTAQFKRNEYNISFAQADENAGTVSIGDKERKNGDSFTLEEVSVPLKAEVGAGYVFDGWQIKPQNGEDTIVLSDAASEYTPSSDAQIEAIFHVAQDVNDNGNTGTVHLDVLASDANLGSATGSGDYNIGDEVKLQAQPKDGCSFVEFKDESGASLSAEADYTFVIEKNMTVTAQFKRNEYNISFAQADENAGTVSIGDKERKNGDSFTLEEVSVPLKAEVNAGYVFDGWQIKPQNGEDPIILFDAASEYTPSSDAQIEAMFHVAEYETQNTDDLSNIKFCTVYMNSSDNSRGWIGNYSGTYSVGTELKMLAHPKEGYVADCLTIMNTDTGAKTTINGDNIFHVTVNYNMMITVHFNIKKVKLTFGFAQNSDTGRVSLSFEGQLVNKNIHQYNYGQRIKLTAQETKENSVFFGWYDEEDNLISQENPYSITMKQDMAVLAFFQDTSTPRIISAKPNNSDYGTVLIDGQNVTEKTLNPSGDAELHASENKGCRFVGWEYSGKIVSTSSSYRFNVYDMHIRDPLSYIAVFEKIGYELNVSAVSDTGDTTGITTSPSNTTVDQNEVVHLSTSTTNPDMKFQGWFCDGKLLSANTSLDYTVTGDSDIKALYLKDKTYVILRQKMDGVLSGYQLIPVTKNEEYILRAEDVANYNFVRWENESGGILSTDKSINVESYAEKSLIAVYERKIVTVVYHVNPSGNGILTDGSSAERLMEDYGYPVKAGEKVEVFAIGTIGYRLTSFTDSLGNTVSESPYVFSPTQDMDITANFEPIEYSVDLQENIKEAGNIYSDYDDLANVPYGTKISVTAETNAGYTFDHWEIEGKAAGSDTTVTHTVDDDCEIKAFYYETKPKITAEAYPAEGGTVTGGGSYAYGDTVTLVPKAATLYKFVKWVNANGDEITSDKEDNSLSFTAESSASYYAIFEPEKFDLTVSASSGDAGTVSGGGEYAFGATATLVAQSKDNYKFKCWMQKGKVISTEPTFHYVVENFNPITACFGDENNVIISAYSSSAAFRGQVMGGGLHSKGNSVTIQAVPASGYALDCWTINGEKSENTSDTLTVTANTDAEYVAAFVPKKSNISTIASPSEGGSALGAGDYLHGEKIILRAVPATGYNFTFWTNKAGTEYRDAVINLTVAGNDTYTAHFEKKTVNINVTPYNNQDAQNGTVTKQIYKNGVLSDSDKIEYGDKVVLTAVPNTTGNPNMVFSGYYDVEGKLLGYDPEYTFDSVTADIDIKASFEESYPISLAHTTSAEDFYNRPLPNGFKEEPKSGTISGKYMDVITVDYGEVPSCFTFDGWYEKGTDKKLSSNTSFSYRLINKNDVYAKVIYKGVQVDVLKPQEAYEGVPGQMTASGSGYANNGEAVVLKANLNDDIVFDGWYDSNGKLISSESEYAYTVQGEPGQTIKITPKYNGVICQVTLNATPEEAKGVVVVSGEYFKGEVAEISAFAQDLNYVLEGFIDETGKQLPYDAENGDGTVRFIVSKNTTITAVFKEKSGGSSYDDLMKALKATLTILALAGCVAAAPYIAEAFEAIEAGDAALAMEDILNAIAEILDDGGKHKKKREDDKTHMVTVSCISEPAAGGTTSTTKIYEAPTEAVIKATPKTGYEFVEWKHNGTKVPGSATYSFRLTKESPTSQIYTAVFKKKKETVSLDAQTGGKITVNGTTQPIENILTVEYGTNVSLTAKAEKGYVFDGWKKDGVLVSQVSTYDFTVEAPCKITAVFKKQYTITLEKKSGGKIQTLSQTENGKISAKEGEKIKLEAVPDEGYSFKAWYVDGVENTLEKSAEYSFEAKKDCSVAAAFEKNEFKVTLKADPKDGGTISSEPVAVEGAVTVKNGTSITVSAEAKENYKFKEFTKGEEVFAGESGKYTFTPDSDCVVTAKFEKTAAKIEAKASPEEGGTATPATQNVKIGENASIKAEAKENYEFKGWYKGDEKVSEEAEYSVEAKDDVVFTAKFEKTAAKIETKASPEEGGTATPATQNVKIGENAKIKAEAKENSEFKGWYKGEEKVSEEAEYSVEAKDDVTYTAKFEKTAAKIETKASPEEGGTATPATQNVKIGETASIKAEAKENYEFKGWYKGEEKVSEEAEYSVEAKDDVTYTAKFEKTAAKIETKASPEEGGTATPATQNVKIGETAKIKAEAKENYEFKDWYKGEEKVSEEAEYSVEAKDDVTYTAKFEKTAAKIETKASPEEGGTATPATQNVKIGETAKIKAEAKENYEFKGWYKGEEKVSEEAEYSVEAKDDVTYTAKFEKTAAKIETKASPEEGGTATPATQNVKIGETASIKAEAKENYEFKGWYKGEEKVSEEAEYSVEAKDDVTYTAKFEKTAAKIEAKASPEEGGTATPATQNVKIGETAKIKAEAKENYEFKGWYKGEEKVSEEAEYSVEAKDDITYTAKFEKTAAKIEAKASPEEGGTATPATQNVKIGENASIKAEAKENYEFKGWYKGEEKVSEEAEYSVEAKDDVVLTALFERKDVSISLVVNPDGSGTITSPDSTIENNVIKKKSGKTVTVAAQEKDDAEHKYHFEGWYTENQGVEKKVSSEKTYSFVAQQDITLKAKFNKISECEVTLEKEPEEGGTVSGGGKKEKGKEITVTAKANDGYLFKGWYTDRSSAQLPGESNKGQKVSGSPSYTFEPENDITLTAVFAKSEANIEVKILPSDAKEDIQVTGEGKCTVGEQHTVKVKLDSDGEKKYTFEGWYESSTGKNPISTLTEYSFEVEKDCTLYAKFKSKTVKIEVKSEDEDKGTVSILGGSKHDVGDSVMVLAKPEKGYKFDSYKDKDEKVLSEKIIYTFTAKEDMEITACFKEDDTAKIKASLSDEDGGKILYDSDKDFPSKGLKIKKGDKVSLSVKLKDGYRFAGWYEKDSKVSSKAEYSFTADADRTLQAVVSKDDIQIITTASPMDGGKQVTEKTVKDEKDFATVKASPNDGYSFIGWYEQDNTKLSGDATYIFEITESKVLVAKYQKKEYQIEVSAEADDAGKITGGGKYLAGEKAVLKAVPNVGYTFCYYKDATGQILSTNAEYAFLVTANTKVIGVFEPREYKVTVASNNNLYGSVAGGGTYGANSKVVLTEIPRQNADFIGWFVAGNCVSTKPQYVFLAEKDVDVTAEFCSNQYRVKLSANLVNAGTVSGEGGYEKGQTVTLRATPNFGYNFINWIDADSGDVISEDKNYSFVIEKDRSILGEFAVSQYSVSISAASGGNVAGGGIYNFGEKVSLSAQSEPGYQFSGWYSEINGKSVLLNSSAVFDFTLDENIISATKLKITAKFVPADKITVTVPVKPMVGGYVTGDGEYEKNNTAVLRAVAAEGYQFKNWMDENGAQLSESTEYQFITEKNVTITANFAATEMLHASVKENDSSLGKAVLVTSQLAPIGSTMEAYAQAGEGAEFVCWVDSEKNVLSYHKNYSAKMEKDTAWIAVFRLTTHTITTVISPDSSGIVLSKKTFLYGDTISLLALPKTGYRFSYWTSDSGELDGANQMIYRSVVTQDETFTANFRRNQYTVTVASSPTVGGKAIGGGVVTVGDAVTVQASPSEGYVFDGWYSGEELIDDNLSYTFTPGSDVTLEARFTEKNYSFTISVGANGTASPSGVITVKHNADVPVIFTPEDNYYISQIIANDSIVEIDGYTGGAYQTEWSDVSQDTAISATFDTAQTPKIIVTPDDVQIKPGQSATLTAKGTVESGGLSYQWYKDNQVLSGENREKFTAQTAGNYYCKITNTVMKTTAFVNTKPVAVTVVEGEKLILNPTSLDHGRFNEEYSATLNGASGGEAPYAYVVVDSHLPNGLNFDMQTKTLSGKPLQIGDFWIQMKVTDATGATANATTDFTIDRQSCNLEFVNVAAVYDGQSKSVAVAGVPDGQENQLKVYYTGILGTEYAKTTSAPVNAGSYLVQAVLNTPNVFGEKYGRLVIAKAKISLQGEKKSLIYDGKFKQAHITASVPGIPFSVHYEGTGDTPLCQDHNRTCRWWKICRNSRSSG